MYIVILPISLVSLIIYFLVFVRRKKYDEWRTNMELDNQIASSYAQIHSEKDRDKADELKKWHDLKIAGAITDEEFEQKKKIILK
ncbi:MAG: SHOCT domain-containing protein [Chitinophagia bacterium]|nr:SHOCT domain-containing protein [Chitinophagia bacterium]